MRFVETNADIAYDVLRKRERKVVTLHGKKVIGIDLNTKKIKIETSKYSSQLLDIENTKLYICVPRNAKRVY